MLKSHSTTHYFLVLNLILLSVKTAYSQTIANCQLYKTSGSDYLCEQCIYGYRLESNNHCTPSTLVRVLSILMTLKYIQPFITFRSIFADLIGDYWFFASNQTHTQFPRKLTQFIISINNERLWPFSIIEKFQLLVGQQRIKQFHDFLGLQDKPSQRDLSSPKRDLLIFEKREFSFIWTCGIRLMCSLGISLSVWIGLQLVEGTVYFLTNKRILEKRSIKGSLLLMIVGQLQHFVGFYGFYQVRNCEGYSQFGIKMNIAVTVLSLFLFGFLLIILLPVIYYLNDTGPKTASHNIKQQKQSIGRDTEKVHRVLTFTRTLQGYGYYLLFGLFRHFCSGCIIGYFYDGNAQYIVLAIWYGVEWLLLEDFSGPLSVRVYHLFRKGYVMVSIVIMILLYEENLHAFSDPDYSFRPVLEIFFCFLHVIALLQFLLQIIQILWKILSNIKNWLKIKNKVYNSGTKEKVKQKSEKRNHLREPSIAERVLKTLKTVKFF